MHPLLRFTLDLFESNQPLTHVPLDSGAIKNTANARQRSVKPPPLAVPQGAIKHPQATRSISLGGVVVAYEFKRGQRRSIGLRVGTDGLAVRAPKWVTLNEVESVLTSKSAWILRKLHDARERQTRLAHQVIAWQEGVSLPYLGQTVTLRLDPEHRFSAAGAALDEARQTLWLSLPHGASPEQIRDAAQAWLMRQAKQLFEARLDHFAPLLGVRWTKLTLSNAGTRWGSARADGSIRLNWRLIHLRHSAIDYVVAHELSHLRVMDHSPRFWDTVRTVVPDYAQERAHLKTEGAPRWG